MTVRVTDGARRAFTRAAVSIAIAVTEREVVRLSNALRVRLATTLKESRKIEAISRRASGKVPKHRRRVVETLFDKRAGNAVDDLIERNVRERCRQQGTRRDAWRRTSSCRLPKTGVDTAC